jgi:CBS domain-containing protein
MEFYVKDIMTTDIITVKENSKIRELVNVFAENEIYGVPVLDEEDFVIGVVSSIDILKKEESENFYSKSFLFDFNINLFEDSRFFDKPVSSIMTKELITVTPDDTIEEMARIMYENKIHRVLVIKYDKLIGIVSTFDLLKLLAAKNKPDDIRKAA